MYLGWQNGASGRHIFACVSLYSGYGRMLGGQGSDLRPLCKGYSMTPKRKRTSRSTILRSGQHIRPLGHLPLLSKSETLLSHQRQDRTEYWIATDQAPSIPFPAKALLTTCCLVSFGLVLLRLLPTSSFAMHGHRFEPHNQTTLPVFSHLFSNIDNL